MSFAALPNAVFFAVTGIIIFAASLLILLRVLPGQLWSRALDEGNMAAALIVASLVLAISWIIAAAVH
jgi:putative membrane protein